VPQDDVQDILIGADLTSGLDMGVNSSNGRTDWLESQNGAFKMSYPANQTWGAVFITVGPPTDPPRPFRDFSAYRTLSIEMKGGPGARTIDIGVKTNTQPDNGRETKKTENLTQDWRTYEIALSDFTGTDLSRLYVVTEFVFARSNAQTVYFRNIKYLKRDPRPAK
jgi:hypothetical protein